MVEGRTLIEHPGQRPYVKYASNGSDRVHFAFTQSHPPERTRHLLRALPPRRAAPGRRIAHQVAGEAAAGAERGRQDLRHDATVVGTRHRAGLERAPGRRLRVLRLADGAPLPLRDALDRHALDPAPGGRGGRLVRRRWGGALLLGRHHARPREPRGRAPVTGDRRDPRDRDVADAGRRRDVDAGGRDLGVERREREAGRSEGAALLRRRHVGRLDARGLRALAQLPDQHHDAPAQRGQHPAERGGHLLAPQWHGTARSPVRWSALA